MFTRKFNDQIAMNMLERKMIVEQLNSNGESATFKVNDGDNKLSITIDKYVASDDYQLEDSQELVHQSDLFDFDFVNSRLIDANILGFQKVYGNIIFYSNDLVFEKDNKILHLVTS